MKNMTNASEYADSHFPEPYFLLFEEVPWMVVFICEAILILTENSVTIYIFWNIRKRLRRTSYLLINLAISDISVGLAAALYIGADVAVMLKRHVSCDLGEVIILTDIVATVSSILSLVIISLDRMFAILWPFRHRLSKTRNYFVYIGCVWLLSVLNMISNIRFDSRNATSEEAYSIFTVVTIIIAVSAITVAYLAIWIATRRNQISSKEHRSMEQNRKLAKTLFIVTALSIITCLPYGIVISNTDYATDDPFSFKVQITKVAQYANSFLNPIIYCFRMPEFKASLKKLFCRRSRNRLSWNESSRRSTSAVTLRSIKSLDSF